VELGYARVSTAKQDLDRQIQALAEAGVARERIYVDKSRVRRSTGQACGRCWISRVMGT
jgi:DNA invertase Pin-like site-specific DNA recombinase